MDFKIAPVGPNDLLVEKAASWNYNDPNVWEMISTGGARAVHHIESPAMINLCRMTNVRDIDGLIAIVSVIRPGAANEQKKLKFTRRYQGIEPAEYPHPSLEDCLKTTFGLVVYEEHILQICEIFAGISAGRADILRRALNKHQDDVIETFRREFFSRSAEQGHDDKTIREVWELLAGFSGYAFCKAHSTAYGVEAYQSAWLKCYFPVEFMAAVLTHGKGFYHPLVYVLECHRLGIQLQPPSVNEPGPGFIPETFRRTLPPNTEYPDTASEWELNDSVGMPSQPNSGPPDGPVGRIRVPVSYIKGISRRTVERIQAERDQGAFTSIANFHRRLRLGNEEMELLIRAGAFDEFRRSRPLQVWESIHVARTGADHQNPDQGWLIPEDEELAALYGKGGFDSKDKTSSRLPVHLLKDPDRHQQLLWETELLGFCASGHPLDLYEDVAWETYCPIDQLHRFVGSRVVVCGLVVEQRIHQDVTGESMKFMTIADSTGMLETELFARTYKSYAPATYRYPVLEVVGRVEPFENGRGHSLRVMRAGKPRMRRQS